MLHHCHSSIKTSYEDIGSSSSSSSIQISDRNKLLTNGVICLMHHHIAVVANCHFSTIKLLLSYKHMMDLNTANVTTIRWKWK